MSFQKHAYYWKVKKIQWVSLLDYVHYDKNSKRSLKQNSAGVIMAESITDRSSRKVYQGYILPRKFGMNKLQGSFVNTDRFSPLWGQALEELTKTIMEEAVLKQDVEFVPKSSASARMGLWNIVQRCRLKRGTMIIRPISNCRISFLNLNRRKSLNKPFFNQTAGWDLFIYIIPTV